MHRKQNATFEGKFGTPNEKDEARSGHCPLPPLISLSQGRRVMGRRRRRQDGRDRVLVLLQELGVPPEADALLRPTVEF